MLIKFGSTILCGVFMAGGQALMTIYALSIPKPIALKSLLVYSCVSWSFYCTFLAYGISFLLYVQLLRFYPLSEVTVSIFTVMVLTGVAFTYLLGQSLNLMQFLGMFLVIVGFILLQIH